MSDVDPIRRVTPPIIVEAPVRISSSDAGKQERHFQGDTLELHEESSDNPVDESEIEVSDSDGIDIAI